MADVLAMYLRACDGFDGKLAAVTSDDWSRSTPCSEWDVRALVNHLAAEQLWAPPLLDGATIADVGDAYDGDVLGDDPHAAWNTALSRAKQAFTADGALGRTVHLSFGDVPAEVYGWQMTMDLLIHGWDLARGIGADEAMDPELVSEVYERTLPMMDDLAASGMFAPPVELGPHAQPEARLLALFGRRA